MSEIIAVIYQTSGGMLERWSRVKNVRSTTWFKSVGLTRNRSEYSYPDLGQRSSIRRGCRQSISRIWSKFERCSKCVSSAVGSTLAGWNVLSLWNVGGSPRVVHLDDTVTRNRLVGCSHSTTVSILTMESKWLSKRIVCESSYKALHFKCLNPIFQTIEHLSTTS